MPSPKHKCATPGCNIMLARKEAIHCRKHVDHTPEWVEKVAAKTRGQKRTLEQRAKISAACSGPGELNRVCPVCNKSFSVDKPSQKNRSCSRACGYKQRRGDGAKNWNPEMPIIICKVCGKKFRANTTTQKRFFCSYTCRNIWMLTHQKNTNTNIEQTMQNALDAHGIKYLKQQNLCNTTIADFYIPSTNAAIYCDGDYWHSLPGKKEHDAKKTQILIEHGFIVQRFLGSKILSNIESCIHEIKHPYISHT